MTCKVFSGLWPRFAFSSDSVTIALSLNICLQSAHPRICSNCVQAVTLFQCRVTVVALGKVFCSAACLSQLEAALLNLDAGVRTLMQTNVDSRTVNVTIATRNWIHIAKVCRSKAKQQLPSDQAKPRSRNTLQVIKNKPRTPLRLRMACHLHCRIQSKAAKLHQSMSPCSRAELTL